MKAKRVSNDTFKVRFKYPQAPKNQRPPRGEGSAIPNRLMDDMCLLNSAVDRCVYLWIAAKTYGQHRRESNLSYSEISLGTRISIRRAAKAIENIRHNDLAEIIF
jgi:hypothetical protein